MFIFIVVNNSLVLSMNLLVRFNKIRRRLGYIGINFGFLMWVKMFQLVVKEVGDDLDGIIELECIEDDSQQ